MPQASPGSLRYSASLASHGDPIHHARCSRTPAGRSVAFPGSGRGTSSTPGADQGRTPASGLRLNDDVGGTAVDAAGEPAPERNRSATRWDATDAGGADDASDQLGE